MLKKLNLNENYLNYLGIVFFIGIGVLSRIVDHIPNFTPIVGISLFIAYLWNRLYSSFFVITTMFISNLILGYEFDKIQGSVYLSFLIPVILGRLIQKTKNESYKYLTIVGISIISSTLFYFITNFAVWLWSGMYDHTLNGFILCYELALPFYRNTLLGDLFSSIFIFSVYDLYIYLIKNIDEYRYKKI
jgi:hypothetical protein